MSKSNGVVTLRMFGVALGVSAGMLSLVGCSKPAENNGASASAPLSQTTPVEALAKCDRLAAAPGDPQRVNAPVADDAFAPGIAVTACADAVALNGDNARAHFEYGRALSQGGRNADAFEQFKAARLAGYPAASLYLANAYRDGHLPPGESANLATAVAVRIRGWPTPSVSWTAQPLTSPCFRTVTIWKRYIREISVKPNCPCRSSFTCRGSQQDSRTVT